MKTETNNDLPKHRQVYRHLREAIAAGEYGPGARLPTENELMEMLGVSRSTVVRALRDLQQERFIERRRGSGSYVRRADDSVRKVFGLVVSGVFPDSDPGNNIFFQVFGEMSRLGGERNCALVVGDALADKGDVDTLAEKAPGRARLRAGRPHRQADTAAVPTAPALAARYIEKGFDGVFFMPLLVPADRMETNVQIVGAFGAAGVPVVLLDRDIYDHPRRSRCDLVGIDNFQAGWALTRHLLEHGCRRIDFVASPNVASSVTARIAGYREALSGSGIDAKPAWIHRGSELDPDFVRSTLKRTRTDAFVCEHDGVGLVMLREAAGLGVKVPRDVRVVGFDDSPLAAHIPVPLTTMRQPTRHLAAAAFKAMLERVENPDMPERTICLGTRLVARRSCGCG